MYEESPVSLGAEIRRLRRGSGLSQRELTRQIGLSAHSNLAEYEACRRIPPADIVTDLERVLGVTGGSLQDLRSAALIERAEQQDSPESTDDADAKSRSAELPSPSPAAAGLPDAVPAGRRFRLRRRHLLSPVSLAIISAVIVASAGLIAASGSGGHTAAATALSPNGTRLTDNIDPERSQCNLDAVVLESVPLRLNRPVTVHGRQFPAGTVVGAVELRYSPACHAAWARLNPIPALAAPGLGAAVIYVVRPADHRRLAFKYRQVAEIYGNILLTASGCVRAGASIDLASGASASAATPCVAGPD